MDGELVWMTKNSKNCIGTWGKNFVVLISLIDKVFYDWIKDLELNPYLYKKSIDVLVW